MKRLLYASIFIFCFSILAFAQTLNLPCPEITVSGPDSLVNPGDSITFTVNVKNLIGTSKLEFEWKVSQGTILQGQGTNQISVATILEMDKSVLTATVKIKDLNSICDKEISETAVIDNGTFDVFPQDEYGKLEIDDERARLDNYFVSLVNSVGSKGYIYFGIKKGENIKTVKNRISTLLKHFDFRKIDRNLVTFDICYTDECRTVLWVVPKDAFLPDYGECKKVNIDLK